MKKVFVVLEPEEIVRLQGIVRVEGSCFSFFNVVF
jgi:hypothetical protein